MKKTLVRLLSVILAAVMVFPAAFATNTLGGEVELWCGTTKQNTYDLVKNDGLKLADVTNWSTSGDGKISLDEKTGVVTALKPGSVALTALHTESNEETGRLETSIVATWYFTIKKRTAESIAVTKTPTKWKDYVSGETFDPTGMVITVTYNNGETGTVDLSLCKFMPDPLTAGTTEVTILWGELAATTSVTVWDSGDISLYAGDTYQINYSDPAVSGWVSTNPSVASVSNTGLITAHRAGTTVVRAFDAGYNTIGGIYNITVIENTLTPSVIKKPIKKAYKVGESFDPTGMEVQMIRPDRSVYVTLSDVDLARYIDYTFTKDDVTTGNNTITKTFPFTFEGKLYSVSVSGFTVTVAPKTLTVNTSRSLIVEMKNKSYPVGTTIDLSDINRIGYFDTNNREAFISYPETMEYGNLSLEVLTVNSKGATTTKTSNKNRVDSADVFTDKYDEKLVTLRLSVGDNYHYDFEVSSGEPAVSVYLNSSYSSSYLLGIFDDLAKALNYVNDVNYQWGSTSASVYAASRTMYLKLGKDADLGRYYVLYPARNFEIDLNGHKLTMYKDFFRFRDKYDTYTATLTNKSSTTSKVTYIDLPGDDWLTPLIDKAEKIVFKCQDFDDTSIPGIYTVTVASGSGGSVAAKPAVSSKNTVTIAHGNDVTFTITPEKNYEIDTVKVKSGNYAEQIISVSTNSSYSLNTSTGVATYTMKDVKADATLTAAFRKTINPGDMDGDGTPATPRDAMVLARYIAGWDGYEDKINLDAADLDGDGIPATPKDAMVLARHIARWAGYETIPLSDNTLKVTKHPVSVTLKSENETVTFTAEISGGKAPYTYKWFTEKDNGTTSTSAVSGKTVSTYAVSFSKESFEYTKYLYIYCVVTDSDGRFVQSEKAAVTPYSGPLRIVKQPAGGTFNEGETVTLSVSVSGGRAPYAYEWQATQGSNLWGKIGQSAAGTYDDTMSFKAAYGYFPANEYIRCVIWDADGSIVISDEVYVEVKSAYSDPLQITKDLVDYQLTSETDIGWFEVAVSGGRAPYTYKWYVVMDSAGNKGKLVYSETSEATESECFIVYVDDYLDQSNFDRYVYVYCEVTDANNTLVTTKYAKMLACNELKITAPTSSLSVAKDKSITLKPTVTGGIAPYTYEWNINGTISSATGSSYEFHGAYSTGTKYVTVTVTDDRGKCASYTWTITVTP